MCPLKCCKMHEGMLCSVGAEIHHSLLSLGQVGFICHPLFSFISSFLSPMRTSIHRWKYRCWFMIIITRCTKYPHFLTQFFHVHPIEFNPKVRTKWCREASNRNRHYPQYFCAFFYSECSPAIGVNSVCYYDLLINSVDKWHRLHLNRECFAKFKIQCWFWPHRGNTILSLIKRLVIILHVWRGGGGLKVYRGLKPT